MMQPGFRRRPLGRAVLVTLLLLSLSVITHVVWPRVAGSAPGGSDELLTPLRADLRPGAASKLAVR
jgi:hypothetical protein